MSDLHTLSATALQEKLSVGETTSVELVHVFLERIEKYASRLKALISVAPRDVLLARAAALDAERTDGKVRGNLHGIPIIIKDSIMTAPDLGMATTAGCALFAEMTAKKNATAVERLLNAGMIIMAKANMTEFCGHKTQPIGVGWSAVAGQTLSPYRRKGLEEDDQPVSGGSSSGSAVSLCADLTPVALGTETAGSCIYPSSVCGVYGMKLGHKTAPTDGIFSISESYDALGPMVKDPRDLVDLVEVLEAKAHPEAKLQHSEEGREFDGLFIGVVSSTWEVHESMVECKWGHDDVVASYEAAVNKLRERGAKIVYPLQLSGAEILKHGDEGLMTTAYYEFNEKMKQFISCFEDKPGITDLASVIEWNKANAAKAMPEPYTGQTEIIKSLESKLTEGVVKTAVLEMRRIAGQDGLAATMKKEGDLDIVLSSSECQLAAYAACTGWPIASVPLGHWPKNGQPIGMFAVSKDGNEDTLMRFLQIWAKVFNGVNKPNLDELP